MKIFLLILMLKKGILQEPKLYGNHVNEMMLYCQTFALVQQLAY